MPQGGIDGRGRRERKPRPKARLQREPAKDKLVELVQDGMSIGGACERIQYARKTYEQWRRDDPAFAARVDQARQLQSGKRSDEERGERLGFAEWRKKYLGITTPWHQMQWVDILEGREPRDLHESQTYTKGRANRILINCPPFHPVEVSTPILTGAGWRTIGEVQVGDTVFDSEGRATKVADTWEPDDEVDLYEVEFSTGDKLTVDGRHLWYVTRPDGKAFELSTIDLMGTLRYGDGLAKWRVPVAKAVSGLAPMGERPEALPLDPYILGYWLGDGATGKPEVAVGEQDKDDLLRQIEAAGLGYTIRPQRGGYSVYVKGIRGILNDLGVLRHKHIPDAYMAAVEDDRLAVLQGLMDSDGSIVPKDGRAYFAQHPMRSDLLRDTYRLIASLGYRPTRKDETRPGVSPATGLPYVNEQHRIYFKPNGRPVFRLERKVANQKFSASPRTTNRTIRDIRPAGRGRVKCLTVLSPGSLYLIGDACILTRNGKSIALTVDYSVYRLCMNPSFRILIISAGSSLANDFVYGIKQRLTSPEFIELQKAYAPDGGWEATSESWTESRIVFGTKVRAEGDGASHEKDANVLALGMRSKVYGRRADLIFVDDGVDGTNVAEYAKQMKWLRREVESRLEAGGKLVLVGTRIAPVDLYSELMKPENYANQKVPWTHLASPAILEEGATPAEHKTLWPYADVPWVPQGTDDSCLCENTAECSAGVEVNGQIMYPRWDGVHLEMGPRASNNNTDWALIYQQKSVAEDATFPEHAVQRCINGARYCGPLAADKVGHPYGGMHNKYVIAGLDPAVKGHAGIVVGAVDRETNKRYIMHAWNLKAPTGKQLKDKMKEVTLEFGVDEWRVEKTGLLQFFTQDAELRQWFTTRGVRFTEHLTGKNKWDATFGVSSLAPLFGEYDRAWDDKGGEWREITPPLIELPRPNLDGVKALVHQLVTWTPELDPNKVPCDLVMALWFFEVGAREYLGVGKGRASNVVALGRSNRFVSPRSAKNRSVVNFADYRGGGL